MKELLFVCIGSLLLFFIVKDGRKASSWKAGKKIKPDEFKNRPSLTWTRRDPKNPIDTDF